MPRPPGQLTRLARWLRLALVKRWRAFRLGFFFLRHRDLRLPATIRVKGVRYPIVVPSDDWAVPGIFAEVLLEDVYRIRSRRGRFRTIADVGANVGVFSLAARLANPDARIHAYEPNPRLEPYLAAQCRAASATYFLEAVAAEFGRKGLIEASASSGYTRTVTGDEVPAIPLSEVVARMGGSIDLLKLDCEGAEWELFADRAAWAKIQSVAMEYHLPPAAPSDAATKQLVSLGFRVDELRPIDASTGIVLASRPTAPTTRTARRS